MMAVARVNLADATVAKKNGTEHLIVRLSEEQLSQDGTAG